MNVQMRIITADNIDQLTSLTRSNNIELLTEFSTLKEVSEETERKLRQYISIPPELAPVIHKEVQEDDTKLLDEPIKSDEPDILGGTVSLGTIMRMQEKERFKQNEGPVPGPYDHVLRMVPGEYPSPRDRPSLTITTAPSFEVGNIVHMYSDPATKFYKIKDVTTSGSIIIIPEDDTMGVEQLVYAKDIYKATSPAFAPSSPAYAPSSPAFAPSSPAYAPGSSAFAPGSPAFAPSSPAYAPGSPAFAPGSPAFAPGSPAFAPSSPAYAPGSPAFAPSSPAYAPGSPVFAPGSPAFAPRTPTPPPSVPGIEGEEESEFWNATTKNMLSDTKRPTRAIQ